MESQSVSQSVVGSAMGGYVLLRAGSVFVISSFTFSCLRLGKRGADYGGG